MTKIMMADHAGFCFGVKKAVENVYEEAKQGGNIYTYGPIIHNEIVVKDLEQRGVKVIRSIEEIDGLQSGTVIIRSHGVARDIYERISRNTRIRCVDATCPFVKRIHSLIQEKSSEGYHVVIIGNKGHAEVEGHIGWSSSPAEVIETQEEAERFQISSQTPVCIVAQTTFNARKFEDLVDILNNKGYNTFVMNTICNATNERQQEAAAIAKQADIMIVIGDKDSSNSAKLYEICRKECPRTVFIQAREDLDLVFDRKDLTIGITAGASTPQNIIQEVQDYVRTGTDF